MKLLFTCLAIAFGSATVYSQNTLNFCGYVDQNGFCFLNNTKYFLSANDSVGLFMEVIKENGFTKDEKLSYKIYSVNSTGEEKYENMVEQNVKTGWGFAWLPHLFGTAGKYNIKVFDEAGQLLCSKPLELVSVK